MSSGITADDVTISPVKIVAQLASVNEVDVFSIQSLYFETLTNTLSSLSLCFPQTHYTEVVQGAIFMEQNMSFWAGLQQKSKSAHTPTPWLALLLVLGKSRVNQNSC